MPRDYGDGDRAEAVTRHAQYVRPGRAGLAERRRRADQRRDDAGKCRACGCGIWDMRGCCTSCGRARVSLRERAEDHGRDG